MVCQYLRNEMIKCTEVTLIYTYTHIYTYNWGSLYQLYAAVSLNSYKHHVMTTLN